MTVSTSQSQITVYGNGATTVFNFPFIGAAAADISVMYTDTNGNQTTLSPSQYTLILNAATAGQLWGIGGTVTYPTVGSPIASGTSLTITRSIPYTQGISIQNQSNIYPQVTEQAMDLLEMQIQQVAARGGKFRGTWITGIPYTLGDFIIDGSNGANTLNYYMCTVANTSGTWATDLAAGDWTLVINVAAITASQTAAAASATAAASSATSASTSATNASASASAASASATAAASSAASASASAAALTIGTSTSSNTIGTGAKTFTTQSGLALVPGGYVQITSQANGANYMYGSVTSYSGTSLVVNVTATGGAGTLAAWNITLAPPLNAAGSNNQVQINSSGILAGVTALPNGITATTQTALDNSTKIATTAYADALASNTLTLTNKRLTCRLSAVTQSATPAINTDNMDIADITGLAQAITSMTTNLTGTPVNGDKLEIRITDNGTGRAITWGASFQSTTVTLPTTTVSSTMLRTGFEWNATASKWDCIAVA